MRLRGPAPVALPISFGDRLLLDAALDEAFAPLRARSSGVGAARIRAASRWIRPEPPVRGVSLLTRVGDLAVAAAVSAFVFGASIASFSPISTEDGLSDGSRDAVSAGQWTLNGRTALQRPIDSRATDYLTTAGELAANAATVRREASRSDLPIGQPTANQ